MVASGDQLDSNLVYFFCNPTEVLHLFLFCNFVCGIFLTVKSIKEIRVSNRNTFSLFIC